MNYMHSIQLDYETTFIEYKETIGLRCTEDFTIMWSKNDDI